MADNSGFPHTVEAAAECPAGGVHNDFPVPDDVQGRPFNKALLSTVISAAMHHPSGCKPCQAAALDDIADDPDTFTRLAVLAAMFVASEAGGLPPAMLDPEAGVYPELLVRLWAAGTDKPDGTADEYMHPIADAADRTERREAASTSLDMIVGMLRLVSGA